MIRLLLLCPLVAQAQVVASSGPVASMAEAMGAEILWPHAPGADPAHDRPSIEMLTRIQQADLILLNGADYASWPGRVSLPRARTVVTMAGLEDRLLAAPGIVHSHGDAGEHSHTGTVGETWLDFEIAALQAEAVGRALDADAAPLAAALRALDVRAKTLAFDAPLGTDQPGLEHFAEAYGATLALGSPEEAAAQGARLYLMRSDDPALAAAATAAGLTPVHFDRAETPGDLIAILTASLDRLETALAP